MNYNVLEFANQELQKYLKILNVDADISLAVSDTFDVEKPDLDDAYSISITNRKGSIKGSNDRSVLFGVYRLLEEWGITWVRPGPNGTKYPQKCSACDLSINEIAAKRYRVMCIEGAISFENVIDMVDWMTKLGFNGYYIQFSNSFEFFERWYSHDRNPYKNPEPFTYEKADEFIEIITHEIKKRGLMLHRMGHGWHCLAFGFPIDKPITLDEIPKEFLEACAMIDGKRECYQNTPSLTQLCYSNPKVVERMTDAVLNYATEHPEIDVLYFWLADRFNCSCECEECTKTTINDIYVNMVDIATKKLRKNNINTKLVLSGIIRGVPEEKRIEYTENTILQMSPITRTMAYPFPENYDFDTTLPVFEHNKRERPTTAQENFAYLYHWKKIYKGDVVDFDYHLMWDFMLDAGGEDIARVAHIDIKRCDNLGVNGYISCQLQRNAFPSSIAMTAIAKTLWNSDTDFEEMRRKLYAATFGEESVDTLCNYFGTLSSCFKMGVIRDQIPYDSEQVKKDMLKAKKMMDDFETEIDKHLNAKDPCQKDSWMYLKHHRVMYSLIAESIYERLCGNYDKANKLRDDAIAYSFAHEDDTQPVLDAFFFSRMMHERINLCNHELDPPPLN